MTGLSCQASRRSIMAAQVGVGGLERPAGDHGGDGEVRLDPAVLVQAASSDALRGADVGGLGSFPVADDGRCGR